MQITKSGIARATALGLLVVAMGCERADPRLKNLHVGMVKDSVMVAMEGASPRRTDPFLYKGQYIEAMLFQQKGKTDPESLEDRKMAPVIVINGKLVGWGWDYWDSVAAANNIPVKKPQ